MHNFSETFEKLFWQGLLSPDPTPYLFAPYSNGFATGLQWYWYMGAINQDQTNDHIG